MTKMDITQTTRGPWRWGDWSTNYGTMENAENLRCLEHLPGAGTEPQIREKDEPTSDIVVRLNQPTITYNSHDIELIRRAPELATALAAMLVMFGNDMEHAEYRRLSELAGLEVEE